MNLCRKNKHDLDNPDNYRKDKRGVIICKLCDNEYQKSKVGGPPASLPAGTKVIINGYKEPLRPVIGGFGFVGTIAYDENEEYTQCHICGDLYRHLGKHVAQSHEMNSNEYKEKFGLDKSTSLLAANTRSSYVKKWENMSDDDRKVLLDRLKDISGNRYHHRSQERYTRRLEYYNKRGSCPDQIIDKIITLSSELGRTPSSLEFQERWGGKHYSNSARLHFGSWQEAVRQAGLTPLDRHAPIRYTDEQLIESLIEFKKRYGREPYYKDLRTGLLLGGSWVYRNRFGRWSTAKKIAFSDND